MKTINLQFTDNKELKKFIDKNRLKKEENLLIQIFTGTCNKKKINTLVKSIIKLLPQAKIVGSTTDGEIINGTANSLSTVLSFSIFEKTKIEVYSVGLEKNSYETGLKFIENILHVEKAKVLISFVSGLKVNGEDYLKAFEDKVPNLVISGGLAGDNAEFIETFIFTQDGVSEPGAVGVVLYGEDLEVNVHYNFSWENIGKLLTVTKSHKNRVYTIDGIKAEEIYGQYLGEKVKEMLPATGVEFPLIIKKGKLNIARAVLNKHEDGSLSFAGNIEEGSKVQFGYGNIESILNEAPKKTDEMIQHPIESIFVFSCMARKRLLGSAITAELELLSRVAPMSGFFTYGEFFHYKNNSNELLNQTMTTLTLSESKKLIQTKNLQIKDNFTVKAQTVSALSHLISVTSTELHELNEELETKVMEKTYELKKLNKELEEKIKLETKKVQEQYDTLAEAQKSMIENEKYASLGTLVAGVAHEINTPVGLSLTGITHIEHQLQVLETAFNNQEMTEKDFTDFVKETKLMAKSINSNLIKAAHLVKSFKQVAVDQSSEEDRFFNGLEYINEILLSLNNKIKLTKVNVHVEINPDIIIKSNPGSFSQVITNLVLNSLIHAFDQGEEGDIFINMHLIDTDLSLTYRDNGKGMSQEVQSKIFDPFFTTNRSNGGSGLGMNIIHNIITRNLKGTIRVHSEISKGTSFHILIPNVYDAK